MGSRMTGCSVATQTQHKHALLPFFEPQRSTGSRLHLMQHSTSLLERGGMLYQLQPEPRARRMAPAPARGKPMMMMKSWSLHLMLPMGVLQVLPGVLVEVLRS